MSASVVSAQLVSRYSAVCGLSLLCQQALQQIELYTVCCANICPLIYKSVYIYKQTRPIVAVTQSMYMWVGACACGVSNPFH